MFSKSNPTAPSKSNEVEIEGYHSPSPPQPSPSPYGAVGAVEVVATVQDKSADVRKAAEVCFGEILKVCGHEMMMFLKAGTSHNLGQNFSRAFGT